MNSYTVIHIDGEEYRAGLSNVQLFLVDREIRLTVQTGPRPNHKQNIRVDMSRVIAQTANSIRITYHDPLNQKVEIHITDIKEGSDLL